ncbi:SAM-dependent methyltransferase, partial [Streptomyces hainanensis]
SGRDRGRRLGPGARGGGRNRAGVVAARVLGTVRVVAVAGGLGALGPPPGDPAHGARLRGPRHSRARDRAAVSHHYDLSNAFYALLLDPTMSYSCAYWRRPPGEPDHTIADAQRDKLELICRKLELGPGSRLLDIGCGWGALARHAAAEHGALVTAVTLSREQAGHVRRLVTDDELTGRVDVLHADYRELPELLPVAGFDAVTSVEMGEHVGDAEYPAFAALLRHLLRPGGRLLVQQMSRGRHAPGGGAFIETYIAPDMHMRPLAQTIGLLADAGLEIRATQALREHYAWTTAAWLESLECRWDAFTALVGEPTARVWRLYLTGGGLAFEEGRMGVDQILATRPPVVGQRRAAHDGRPTGVSRG